MPRRGLLLDRDGVINVDHGYVGHREQFEFKPGLFEFLNAVQDRGYRLAILTNQAGVARGKYTIDDYNRLTGWMLGELRQQGIGIDLVLACFEHPEGEDGPLRRESFWRKPNPGMILEAAIKLDLDFDRSAFLGDQPRDLQAARAGGIKTCLWLTDKLAQPDPGIEIVRSYPEVLEKLPV